MRAGFSNSEREELFKARLSTPRLQLALKPAFKIFEASVSAESIYSSPLRCVFMPMISKFSLIEEQKFRSRPFLRRNFCRWSLETSCLRPKKNTVLLLFSNAPWGIWTSGPWTTFTVPWYRISNFEPRGPKTSTSGPHFDQCGSHCSVWPMGILHPSPCGSVLARPTVQDKSFLQHQLTKLRISYHSEIYVENRAKSVIRGKLRYVREQKPHEVSKVNRSSSHWFFCESLRRPAG